MNKSFWQLWLHSQAALLTCYLLCTDLLALLCYLYRFPNALLIDFIRFSLPLLIVWLVITVLKMNRLRRTLARHLHRQDFYPQTPLEAQLAKNLYQAQHHHQQMLQAVRQQQQEQTDHRNRFAHEIKNHLAILQARAEVQPAVSSQEVTTAVREANYYLDLLLNGERLLTTANDFRFQWLSLAALVETITQDNAALFIAKQLVPAIEIPQDLHLLTDQKWLHFCINQLLSNAIKYAEPGSTIAFTWEQGRLTIMDTGLPITSTDQPRIFEGGFTGRNGHRTTKSTGMGLYFVKQAANRLNFGVRVFSPNEHCTVAQLIFPAESIK